MSDAVAAEVRGYAPDRIVLLPLYPQFSTTTTTSSLADWHRAAAGVNLDVPSVAVCCYPTQPGFVGAVARRLHNELEGADFPTGFRILFSAHGLPERVIAVAIPTSGRWSGPAPRCWEAVGGEEMDHVDPLPEPRRPAEVDRPVDMIEALETAAADGVGAVVVPIAFVSEHSETLVELDIREHPKAGAWSSACPLTCACRRWAPPRNSSTVLPMWSRRCCLATASSAWRARAAAPAASAAARAAALPATGARTPAN